jgi:hypothetical protein
VDDGEPVPMSLDRDASDRTFDRQLAYLGLLDDAAPLFRDGSSAPGVGVLIALPCLVESGLFGIGRKLYGEIGPAFYGLRTTLVTLLLMALLRIKRPEHLKERDRGYVWQSPGARPSAGSQDIATPAHSPGGAPLRRAAGRGASASACRSARTSHGVFIH